MAGAFGVIANDRSKDGMGWFYIIGGGHPSPSMTDICCIGKAGAG
jgi:hypothetical protein